MSEPTEKPGKEFDPFLAYESERAVTPPADTPPKVADGRALLMLLAAYAICALLIVIIFMLK